MWGRNRQPARLALWLFAVGMLSTTTAKAQCLPDPASSGQTVICSGVDANGFAAGAGVNNLAVRIQPGALVNDDGSASITVNDSSSVTNAGALAPAAGLTGISAGSFNTITNNSSIVAVDGVGILVVNSNSIANNGVVNASGPGGGGTAISAGDNNTIANSGVLSAGAGGAGIFAGINNTITNAAAASITVGDDARGMYLAGGNNRVTNAGAITAGNTTGFLPAAGILAINDDNSISNLVGGTISVGQNAAGILTQGERSTIANAGTINASDGGIGISAQGTDLRITNSGSISIANNFAAGMLLQANGAVITNAGTITAGDNGSTGIVLFGDSNTIINSGTIVVGNNSGAGIDVTSAFGSNDIVNTGTITVGTGAIGIRVSGASTVFNTGTINAAAGLAAIEFCGCGPSVLTLGPGSAISGLVIGSGADTFQLGGAGAGTFNLSLIGPGQQYDGFSTFNKVDGSNWTVTGTGNQDWNVLGGTLSVSGTIAGNVVVAPGGALTGAGTVGNTLVAGGGIYAPGNGGPGSSMFVNGSLSFQSGALYLVVLNSLNSSFANVAGNAALDGTVAAAFVAGSTVLPQYRIMQVASHSGNFSGVAAPGGLVGTITTDPNNVYLNFALDWSSKYNLNINQRNVATVLQNYYNSNGSIPAAFAGLSPGGLTQVSGELGAGTQQATFEAMNLFVGLLTDPFVVGRNGGAGGNVGAPSFADEQASLAYAGKRSGAARDAFAKFPTKADVARNDLLDNRWSVWGAAFGGGSNSDGNAIVGSNAATVRAFGFAAGADFRITRETIAGFAVAGGGTTFSVAGTGSGRSDMFQAGAFVRHTRGPAYVTAAAAWSWQDVTTDRTVTAAGVERLHAQFNSNAVTGRLEGGYRYVTPWMGVTPYAAAQFTTYFLPAYAEQVLAGPGNFALNYAAKDVTAARTELGVRLDRSWAMQSALLTLRGRLAWAHDFTTDRSVAPVFQTLPGTSFVVYGAAQPRNSALTTASVEMKWMNGWSAATTFEGQFSDISHSYAGKGIVRYSW